MPENRAVTGQFLPGRSGNPGGRRRSLVATIRRRTRDGRKLVDLLFGIADDAEAPHRDRIAAARVLLEYGWSKPKPEDPDAVDPTELIRALAGRAPHDPHKVYDG